MQTRDSAARIASNVRTKRNYSSLFECPLTKNPCVPSMNEALLFFPNTVTTHARATCYHVPKCFFSSWLKFSLKQTLLSRKSPARGPAAGTCSHLSSLPRREREQKVSTAFELGLYVKCTTFCFGVEFLYTEAVTPSLLQKKLTGLPLYAARL